jgi:hypothetical protein
MLFEIVKLKKSLEFQGFFYAIIAMFYFDVMISNFNFLGSDRLIIC